MVAVIHDQVEQRHEPVEGEGPDALGPQNLVIVAGQQAQAARIVVDDPHIQAGGGLLAQDLVDLAPHFPHADDETFHIDAVLGALQGGQHIGKHRFAVGVVLGGGAVKYRGGGKIPHIAGGLGGAGVLLLQLFLSGGVGGAQGGKLGLGPLHAAAQPDGGALVAPEQVEQAALHRHNGEENQPADLEFRHGGILPDESQAHQDAERQPHAVDPGGVFAEAEKQNAQPDDLYQQQHAGNHQPAEHQREEFAHHMAPCKFVPGHRKPRYCVKMKTHPAHGAAGGVWIVGCSVTRGGRWPPCSHPWSER